MKKEKSQKGFFDIEEWWEKYWQGMPEFSQEKVPIFQTILLHFKTEDDVKEFSKLTKQTITSKTKFAWFPKTDIQITIHKKYIGIEDEP